MAAALLLPAVSGQDRQMQNEPCPSWDYFPLNP